MTAFHRVQDLVPALRRTNVSDVVQALEFGPRNVRPLVFESRGEDEPIEPDGGLAGHLDGVIGQVDRAHDRLVVNLEPLRLVVLLAEQD
jgi:hypothetical protein